MNMRVSFVGGRLGDDPNHARQAAETRRDDKETRLDTTAQMTTARRRIYSLFPVHLDGCSTSDMTVLITVSLIVSFTSPTPSMRDAPTMGSVCLTTLMASMPAARQRQ
jgi:hypothetical protein